MDGTLYGIVLARVVGAMTARCLVPRYSDATWLWCVRGHTQVMMETLVSWREKKERLSGMCRYMHKLVTHIIPTSI